MSGSYNRFVTEQSSSGSYMIVDTEHAIYGMSKMAVSIYFKDQTDALTVCAILNKEWGKFLRNPN